MNTADRAEQKDEFQDGEDMKQAIKETGDMLHFEVNRIVQTMEEIAAKEMSVEDKKEAAINFIKDEFYKGFTGMGMQPANARDMGNIILENIDFIVHNVTQKDLDIFNEVRRNVKEELKMNRHADTAQQPQNQPAKELDEHLLNDFQHASRKEVEGIYATAFNFYNTGRHTDAINLFKLLAATRPRDHRFHFGLGSCLWVTGEHEAAIPCFVVAHHLKQDEPLPLYFLAKCNVKLGHLPEAKTGFIAAKKLMGDASDYSQHVKHANNMIELINKKLSNQK